MQSVPELEYLDLKPDGHYFEASTLRFFRSRIGAHLEGRDGNMYFVTSEQFHSVCTGTTDPRKYSVQVLKRPSGDINTVGEFQEHDTRMPAIGAMKRAADGGPRCSHKGCHVKAFRFTTKKGRRHYTCGNHESDKPKGGVR